MGCQRVHTALRSLTTLCLGTLALFVGTAELQAQLVINLTPGAGLQELATSNPVLYSQALSGFQSAAQIWQDLLNDPVTVNVTVDFAQLDPGVLGQTSSLTLVGSYDEIRGLLSDDRTSADDYLGVSHLPAGQSLVIRTNLRDGSVTISNTPSVNNSNILVTGAQAKALNAYDSTDPDASITFTSDFSWDFDRSNGIQAGAFDFVGAAAHEIGHALGFNSGVDILDLFTGNGPLAGEDINGDDEGIGTFDPYYFFTALDLFRNSSLAPPDGYDWTTGGDPGFTLDGGETYLANFSNGSFNGSDGRQAGHWRDNLELGIMDPTADFGEFLTLGVLDVRAMDAIGWNLKSMPQLVTDATVKDGVPYIISPGGNLTIDGAAASLNLQHRAATFGIADLTVGDSEQGTLTIAGGSVVVSTGGALGANLNSTGSVAIAGVNSAWNIAGGLYVGGTASGSGGTGLLTVGSGGTLTVGGMLKLWTNGALTLNGGSIYAGSVDISQGSFSFLGGTLQTSGLTGGDLAVEHATLVNNGTAEISVSVGDGGLVKGGGTYSVLIVNSGGAVSPGNSPGTMNSLSTSWNSGGKYVWEINTLAAFGGSEGSTSGWDLWNTGDLTIAGPFTIELHSLMNLTASGALANWNPNQSYSWRIATSDGGFSSLANLLIDFDLFDDFNSLNGMFSLSSLDGDNLYLNYSAAVPEPGSLLLATLAGIPFVRQLRKRRRSTTVA